MMHNSNSKNGKRFGTEVNESIELGFGKRPCPLAGTNGLFHDFAVANPRELELPRETADLKVAIVHKDWYTGHPQSGAAQRGSITPIYHDFAKCDWCDNVTMVSHRTVLGYPLELDHYCRNGLCACKHSDIDCWERGCHVLWSAKPNGELYCDREESKMTLCAYCLSHFVYLEHRMDHATDWYDDVESNVGGPSLFVPVEQYAQSCPFIPCRVPGCVCVHGAGACTLIACHHELPVRTSYLLPHRNLHEVPKRAPQLDAAARAKIVQVWATEPWFRLREISLPTVEDLEIPVATYDVPNTQPIFDFDEDMVNHFKSATFENGGLVYCNPDNVDEINSRNLWVPPNTPEAEDEIDAAHMPVYTATVQAAISDAAPPLQQTEDVIQNNAEAVPSMGDTKPSSASANVSWPIDTLDINTIYGREYLVDNNFRWNTLYERGQIVREWNFPAAFLANTRAPYGLAQYHAFFRGDFEITLRLNHYPFAAGCLILVCVPPRYVSPLSATADQSNGTNLSSWTVLPHAFVKAGDEHEVTLKVPWMSEYRMVIPRSLDEMQYISATVKCFVWSPLMIGTGMPSDISGALWARAIEPKMAIKAIPQASSHKKSLQQLTDTLLGDMPLVSTLAKVAGGVMGFFDAPSVNPPDPGSATPADVPRPAITQTPLADFNVPYDGSHFSNMNHKLDVIERCKIPCVFNSFPWESSKAANALLFDKIVHPVFMTARASFSSTENDRDSTELSYWTSLFEFWRGSIDITFEVIATRFHQGQLIICWSPFPVNNKDLSVCSGLACASVTLGSNNNRTTIKIPYVSPTDYKHTRPGLLNGNHLGHLLIFVQNPLVAPTTVSSMVNVLCYINAGEDYELKQPVNLARERIKVRITGSWQAALTDTATDTFNPIPIIQAGNVSQGFYGAKQTDVRVLMRHPEIIAESGLEYNGRHSIVMHGPFMPQNANCKMHKFAAIAWRYWTGSHRCHVHSNITPLYPVFFQACAEARNPYTTTVVNEWVVNPPTTGPNTPYGTTRYAQHVTTAGTSFIIDLPYLNDVPFRFTHPAAEALTAHTQGYWQLLMQPVSTTSTTAPLPRIRFEHSVGDDFQFALPVPVHALQYGAGWPTELDVRSAKYTPHYPGQFDVVDHFVNDEWIEDLTVEGIEPNPGPAFSKPVVQPQVTRRWNVVKQHCDDVWQQIDTYFFIFLVSYFVWYFVFECTGMLALYRTWVRDLTREGVEPNPGPSVLSKFESEKAYMRRLDACFNPMVLQAVQQANFDLASVLSSLFGLIRSIYETVCAVPRVLKGVTQLGCALYKIDTFVESLPVAFTRFLDDILPAMTAIHTLFHGGTAAQLLALASLLRITYRNMPEPIEPQEVPAYDTALDTDGFMAMYADLGTYPRKATVQGLSDVGSAFVGGFTSGFSRTCGVDMDSLIAPDKGVVGSNTYSYLLKEWASAFIANFLRPFGYFLGPGYYTYIRRSCGRTDGFTGVLLRLWHTLLYMFHGDSLNKEWERTQINAIVGTINKFDRLMRTDAFDTPQLETRCLVYDGTNLEFLEHAADQCILFRRATAEFIVPAHVASSCQRIIDFFSKKRRSSLYRTTQPEPIGIFLGGDPGIGKTLLLSNFLPAVLLPMSGYGTGNVDREVFNVPLGEQKFWDGYDSQPFIVLDEMLQEREGADPLLIIRAINAIRMPVNKADLAEKGAVFRSKFFAVSSNALTVGAAYQTVSCPAAIARRLPFSYKLVLRDRYRKNNKLDVDQLNKDLAAGSNPCEVLDQVWDFHPLNLLDGRVQEATVKFSQIVYDANQMCIRRHEGHKAILKTCDTIASAVKRITTLDKAKVPVAPAAPVSTTPVVHAKAQMMSSSTNPFDDDFVDASDGKPDEGAGPSCRVGTVFQATIDRYTDEETMTADDCDQVINILKVCNDKELGFSQKVLLSHLEPGAEQPFARSADFECYYLSAADRIWAKSNLFRRPEGMGKVFPGIIRLLITAGVAFATTLTIFTIIGRFIKQGVSVVTAAAQAYDSVKSTKSMKAVPKVVNAVKNAIPQAGEKLTDEITDRVRKNMRELYMRCEGGKSGSVNVLCLDSRTFLMPNHFYEWHRKNLTSGLQSYCFISVASSEFQLQNTMPVLIGPANSALVRNSNYDNSFKYDNTDTRVVSLTTEVVSHARSIWHFLYPKETPKMFEGRREAVILGHECCMTATTDIDVRVREFSFVTFCPDARMITASSTVCTKVGDCGRPYILQGHPRPVLGMHAFLTDDEQLLGLTPTYYEDIKRTYDELKPITVAIEQADVKLQFGPPTPQHERYWSSKMELLGVGKFGDFAVTHYVPCETKFVRVSYKGILVQHSEWDCDVLPAACRPSGGKHPLFTNLQKYGVNAPISSVPHGFYMHCLQHYVQKLPDNVNRKVLSWHEAINGFENLQPLAMNTSAGFWTSLGFKDGKHQFFTPLKQEYSDAGELLPLEYTFSDKALRYVVPIFGCSFFERVQQMYDECLSGVAPFTIWCSTVKDELLKRPKVEACKSRVFEACGLDLTLLFRKEFGAFLSWFRAHYGFTLHSGIGADKEVVWAEYARIMRRNSSVGFRYDYSNYDGSVTHAGFQFFGDICDAFYKDTGEHRKARWALLEVLRFSLHLANDCFYTSNSGNKSGNPFTDVFNTISNTLCVYLAYLIIMHNHRNQPTLADFDEEVKFLTYGDDVVGTMRPDIMQKCNGPAVQAVLGMLGYKVTDAAKNAVIEDFCPFEDLCFLKSSWRYDGGVWCAPMEKTAILKEIKYRPKAFQYDEEDLQLRLSIVQRFMAHWGADELKKFQVQARSIGLPPSWLTYSYGEFLADMRMKQEGAVLY